MERGQSHMFGEFIEGVVFLLAQQFALFDPLADLLRHVPELRREERRRFAERAVVAAGHANRETAANKLHARSLPHFFGFPQQDRSYLAAAADVSAATGGQIEIRDLD